MRRFSATAKNGEQVIGLALSKEEIVHLVEGGRLVTDLQQAHAGIWSKNSEGGREFTQPRDSYVLLISGDDSESISDALGVEFPGVEEK